MFYPENQPFDALAYWKALAGLNESLVRGLDASTDHRRSIDSAEYWEMEARHWTQCIGVSYSRGKKDPEDHKQDAGTDVRLGQGNRR